MQPYATAVPVAAIARLIVMPLRLLVASNEEKMQMHNLASTLQVAARHLPSGA
jgi:hypothetical protein